MALRVLTDDERQTLQGNADFQNKCLWGIRNYAAYWSIHTGDLLNDTQRIKWVKDRLNSVSIVLNDINDSSISLKAAKLIKGMQLDLNAAPVDSTIIITTLYVTNRFEEIASLYFDLLGENINFSVTGN